MLYLIPGGSSMSETGPAGLRACLILHSDQPQSRPSCSRFPLLFLAFFAPSSPRVLFPFFINLLHRPFPPDFHLPLSFFHLFLIISSDLQDHLFC
jgi:hypothetical protein